MKVHALAGSRRPPRGNSGGSDVTGGPLYRWRVKVSDGSYRQKWYHDPGQLEYDIKNLGERTVVVLASTESAAHTKASAIFDLLPADRQDGNAYSDWTRYERVTATIGDIEEVVQ